MTDNVEYRMFGSRPDIREEGGFVTIGGYAAVFNTPANIGNLFEEQIAPGAFGPRINHDDVVLNRDHGGLPLARTSAGNLSLSEDSHGLKVWARLAMDDPDVQGIVSKLKHNNITDMSFAFRVDDSGDEWQEEEGELPVRTIREVSELIDVSLVGRGAYSETEVGLRSLDAARKQAFKASQPDRRRRLEMILRRDATRIKESHNG